MLNHKYYHTRASPVSQTVNNLPAMQDPGFDTWVGKIPWRRAWQATCILAWRIPIERGAWQATVHGVTKSWARLSG